MFHSARVSSWIVLAVAGGLVVLAAQVSIARPTYFKRFRTKYPKVINNAPKEIRCNICHYGKSKKNRNDYGTAMRRLMKGKPPVKGDQKIDAMLKKTEDVKKPGTNMTFGDLLRAGKLPGTPPKK